MDLNTIIGFVGAFIIMIGFIFNQLNIWKVNDFEYDFINLLGALVLSYYAYQIQSWPFLTLNVVWVVFSAKDCISDFVHRYDWKKKKKK